MTDKQVIEMYESNKSPYEIAKYFNVYANKIRRLLVKNGVKLRSKSEAQVSSLKNGTRKHPTQGQKRSDLVKIKISNKMSERWNEMSLEQRTQRVEKAKKHWDSLTIEQRENLKRSALQGIRKASKNGSKLENFLVEELTCNGYSVEFHKENLIPNEKMQIDIFLPKENIIIEIDGPTHFYPIWGEESLKKHLSADAEKNGLLLQKGFNVIRVKCISKHISQSKQRTLSSNLINLIKQIKSLTKSSLYEVEI